MRSRSRAVTLSCSFLVIAVLAVLTVSSLGSWPTTLSPELQRAAGSVSANVNSLSSAAGRRIASSKALTLSTASPRSSSNGTVPSGKTVQSEPGVQPVTSGRVDSNPQNSNRGDLCPLQYPRLTANQIKAGSRPYIYGAPAKDCVLCKSQEREARFCRKEEGDPHVCSQDLQQALIGGQLNEMSRSNILTFTPCDMWPHLKRRTVWFAGDGTQEDMFRALECFMYEFLATQNATKNEWRHPVKHTANERTRLGIIGVGCTNFIDDTQLCFIRCDVGNCMVNHVLPYLTVAAKTSDLLVVNFGLQFDHDFINRLSDFVEQVRLQQHKLPAVIWKDTVPTHYQSQLGDFVGGQHPFTCGPLAGGWSNLWHSPEGHLETWDPALNSLLYGGTRNHASSQMVDAARLPKISTYNQTIALWQYHREGQCTHYCFPSAPEIGVYGLFAILEEQASKKSAALIVHKAV